MLKFVVIAVNKRRYKAINVRRGKYEANKKDNSSNASNFNGRDAARWSVYHINK